MNSFAFREIELLISPQELVRALGIRMDALWKAQPNAGNTEWTLQVKGFLNEIAQGLENPAEHLRIEVLYTNVVPGVREFMLDVVWWCKKGLDRKEDFMALAAEIEWASWAPRPSSKGGQSSYVRDRVGEDFDKLVVVKCPLKLMIFCTDKTGPDKSHRPMQQIVLEEVDRYLRSYAHHIPGEHYVLLDVASDGYRQAWVRSVDVNGILSPLQDLSWN